MATAAARLLIVVNDAAFFLSHRLPVALAAQRAGYDVHIATAASEPVARIRDAGLPHHVIRLNRGGTNPFEDLATIWDLVRLFRTLRPSLVHLVTPKPVLYGGVAARITGIPAIAAISGLGHVFSSTAPSARLTRPFVTRLYRLALNRPGVRVIFQNAADRETLLHAGALAESRAVMIPGSGVDLAAFTPQAEPVGEPVVTFAARLLAQKGVRDFVAAATLLKARGTRARFVVAGEVDPDNPTSVSDAEIDAWKRDGVVEIAGYTSDVAGLFARSTLVVFPSFYGEGLPKVLAEAAAAGRAVVTTDVPGCCDAIEPGVSGLLVPPRAPEPLADAIAVLLADPERRRQMGLAGRRLAEREFGIDRVIAAHLDLYRSAIA